MTGARVRDTRASRPPGTGRPARRQDGGDGEPGQQRGRGDRPPGRDLGGEGIEDRQPRREESLAKVGHVGGQRVLDAQPERRRGARRERRRLGAQGNGAGGCGQGDQRQLFGQQEPDGRRPRAGRCVGSSRSEARFVAAAVQAQPGERPDVEQQQHEGQAHRHRLGQQGERESAGDAEIAQPAPPARRPARLPPPHVAE